MPNRCFYPNRIDVSVVGLLLGNAQLDHYGPKLHYFDSVWIGFVAQHAEQQVRRTLKVDNKSRTDLSSGVWATTTSTKWRSSPRRLRRVWHLIETTSNRPAWCSGAGGLSDAAAWSGVAATHSAASHVDSAPQSINHK